MLRLLIWLLLISNCSAAVSKYLYEDVPEVEDVGVLEKNDKQILLVEFYSPYCGHCIAFKPHYIEAAKALLAEHAGEITVKAVSCAAHNPLCTEWNVRGVPSIFLVRPGAEPVKENAVALGQAELTWEKMQRHLPSGPVVEETIEAIAGETKGNGEESIIAEKASESTTVTAVENTSDDPDDDNVSGEIVDESGSDDEAETVTKAAKQDNAKGADTNAGQSGDDDDNIQNVPPPPKAGANLAKDRTRDMDKYKDQIKINIQKQQAMKKKGIKGGGNKKADQPVDEYEGATPTMKGNNVQTAEFLERKKKYVNYMEKAKEKNSKIAFDAGNVSGLSLGKPAFHKDVSQTKLAERIPAVKRMFRMGAEEQLILDCTMAIWHGLTFNKALTNWLDLLDVSLPPEWAVHSLIYDVRLNIAFASERFENMKEVVDRYQMRRKYFSPTCRNNKNWDGKLGCGYWRLFHVISVGVAEHRGGLNLIDTEVRPVGTKTFSPEESADIVRDYIAHFFYCGDCAQSFLEDYDDCEKNRRCVRLSDDKYSASDQDWKEFAMWFWEVHNTLSVELVNEAADAQLKKQQKALLKRAPAGPGIASPETTVEALWPDMDDCLVCFNIDGTWNEAAVFRHLEETYWPDVDFDFDQMDSRLIWFEGDTPVNRGLMYLLGGALFCLFYFVRQTVSSPHIQRSLRLAPKKEKL